MADLRRPMSPVIKDLFLNDYFLVICLRRSLERKPSALAGGGQEGYRIGASEVGRAMLGM